MSERDLVCVLREADQAWCAEIPDEWSSPEFLTHLAAAVHAAGYHRECKETAMSVTSLGEIERLARPNVMGQADETPPTSSRGDSVTGGQP